MLYMNYNFEKIGARIKQERKAAGYKSQTEFADYIAEKCYRSCTRQTIANWENGKDLPPLRELAEMCSLFNCEMGYLLCEYDCKTREKTNIQSVIGLTENAIDLLKFYKEWGGISKLETISTIIEAEAIHDGNLASLIDGLTGYLRFNVDEKSDDIYTASTKGITKFQHRQSLSGNGVVYNPTKAHFRLSDIESMYYLKIWDSIKALKAMYKQNGVQ